MDGQRETLARIHQAAMDEFLEKGFADSSLRQIVKNAGVLTAMMFLQKTRKPPQAAGKCCLTHIHV